MKFFVALLIHSFFVQSTIAYLLTPFKWEFREGSARAPPSIDNVGLPLRLTSLIESGQICEARRQSSVKPFFKNIFGNAGFFTVDKEFDSNLFFWFIRKTSADWRTAPVLLWLQGGPGCSSVYGLFGENGPLFKTRKQLKRRKYAWTNHYNVLYVDQPVGSGFSYTRNTTHGYLRDQQQVANHLYEALSQFFKLYSELRSNEFYITGESYAGKYIPAIAYRIHQLKMQKKSEFNLKGLFMISAFYDPVNMLDYSEHTYRVGLVDLHVKEEMARLEEESRACVHSHLWRNATKKRLQIKHIIHKTGHINQLYDYTKQDFEVDEWYIDYIQSDEIRRRIHVGNATYEDCSKTTFKFMFDDIMKSVKSWTEQLVEHYSVAFVSGQLDVTVAYPFVTNALKQLQWSGALEYRQAKRKILYDEQQRVGGYVKSAGNLKDILVRRSGHMVPADQSRFTLKLLDMFVQNKL